MHAHTQVTAKTCEASHLTKNRQTFSATRGEIVTLVSNLLNTVTVYQRVDDMSSVCAPVAGNVYRHKGVYGQELVGDAVSVGSECSVWHTHLFLVIVCALGYGFLAWVRALD